MDFDTKFNLIYDLITYDLDVTASLVEELRDIVTTKWAEELLEGGFETVYEHLMEHDFKPICAWTAKELINQIVEDTNSYWYEECHWTDLNALVKVHKLIDSSFSPIELTKLALKIEHAKQTMSTTAS